MEEHAFGGKMASDPAESRIIPQVIPRENPLRKSLFLDGPVSPWVEMPSGRGSLKIQGFFGVPT